VQAGKTVAPDVRAEKVRLRNWIKIKKHQTSRIRFTVNYIVLPAMFGAVVIMLSLVCIFMAIDEQKYVTLAVVLFCVIGVVLAATVAVTYLSVPIIRKRELQIECAKYDFDYAGEIHNIESIYLWIWETDEACKIDFEPLGIQFNDHFYLYSECTASVETSSRSYRIDITIRFCFENDKYFSMVLEGYLIKIISKFDIQIVNQEIYDYIIHNKEQAFDQIYRYGDVRSVTVT
jgi:hypothetical protein